MKKLNAIMVACTIFMGMFFAYKPAEPAKAIVKKMVLVEQFTATWCGYCPDASETIDALYERYGDRDFILLKHHPSSRGDGMYSEFAAKRAAKLSVSGYPSFYIDSNQSPGRTTDVLKTQIKKAKEKGSDSEITLERSSIDHTEATFRIDFKNLTDRDEIYWCLAEDFVYEAGSNGEKKHRFVTRTGDVVELSDTTGSVEVTVEVDPTWSLEMLRGYAWIESRSGVQNSDYFSFNQPEINPAGEVVASYPNEITFGKMKPNSNSEATLYIRNCGLTSGSVTISCEESFFTFNKKISIPSVTQTKLALRISTDDMDPGIYKGSFTIQGDTYKKNVPFSLQVLHAPQLKVDTELLDFGELKRGKSKTISFTLSNLYDGPVSGSIDTSEDWLRTSPRRFEENAVDVRVSVSTSKLKAGDYTGTVSIKTDGGDKEIPVKLIITAADIIVEPEEVDFGKVLISKIGEAVQDITITNAGDAIAEITVDQIPSFVSISVEDEFELEPEESLKVTVTLNEKKIDTEKYEGNLIFTFSQEEVVVPISVEVVEDPPILRLECEHIQDNKLVVEADDSEVEIDLVIWNDGKGRMNGKIENDAPWLHSKVHSFAILGGRKKTITLKFDPNKASAGVNEGILLFASNGGDVELTVEFTVTKEPVVIKFRIGSKTVTVNNEPTQMDAAPFISNGRTVVPIRIIAEAFGAKIDWDGATQTITITLNDNLISMQIGNPKATVNGEMVVLDTAPVINNGRTFVPLRFIAEAFGAKIDWDGATQTITITL